MVPLNLSPLKILNTALMATFGMTKGREGLQRVILNGFKLSPVFIETLQATGELCRLGQLFQHLPYFWSERAVGKFKIAKESEQTYFFEDLRRKGKTDFRFDLAYHPLKAMGHVSAVAARVQLICKISCRFFFPAVDVGNGRLLCAVEHGIKAISHLDYLFHLDEDKSRSFYKGALSLISESLLTASYLAESRLLHLIVGAAEVITNGFIEARREVKQAQKNQWVDALPNDFLTSDKEEVIIPLRFVSRFFGTTYFVSSFSNIEQYARTLFCINGFAETFSTLTGHKKHPIFSYFSLAGCGMYGLIFPKYFVYWVDGESKKTVVGGLFQMVGICDTLLFFEDNKVLSIPGYIGRILIFKSVLVTISSTITLLDFYKKWSEKMESEEKENSVLEGINAATKVPMTIHSAASYFGHPLNKKKTIFFGTLLGLNNLARGLFWESLKNTKMAQMEKKLAKGGLVA